MEMEMGMGKLPKELVFEILSWVPAKSLLRSKLVCKSWFDFISDSKFIKMHLYRSTQLVLTKPSFMVSTWYEYEGETSLTLQSLNFPSNNNAPPPLKRLPPPFKTSQNHQILGSCNGLVCMKSLYPFQRISIWNPCTNEFKEFLDITNGHINCINTEGFGYDRTNDDYKVICNTCYYNQTGYLETEVKVYTLGTNSWQIAESCQYEMVSTNLGFHVAGALYFMAKKTGSLDIIIISFDVVNERYNREITMPQELQDKLTRSRQPPHNDALIYDEEDGVDFQEIKGCFCISNITVEKFVDVWVMKKDDYGVESWAKSFTIKPPIIAFGTVHILSFGTDIEMLMFQNKIDIVWCNPNNDQTRDLVRLRVEGLASFECFVESLVSLNQVSNSGQKRKRLDNTNMETFVSLN